MGQGVRRGSGETQAWSSGRPASAGSPRGRVGVLGLAQAGADCRACRGAGGRESRGWSRCRVSAVGDGEGARGPDPPCPCPHPCPCRARGWGLWTGGVGPWVGELGGRRRAGGHTHADLGGHTLTAATSAPQQRGRVGWSCTGTSTAGICPVPAPAPLLAPLQPHGSPTAAPAAQGRVAGPGCRCRAAWKGGDMGQAPPGPSPAPQHSGGAWTRLSIHLQLWGHSRVSPRVGEHRDPSPWLGGGCSGPCLCLGGCPHALPFQEGSCPIPSLGCGHPRS